MVTKKTAAAKAEPEDKADPHKNTGDQGTNAPAKKKSAKKSAVKTAQASQAKKQAASRDAKADVAQSRKEQLAADRPVMRGGGVKVSDTTLDLNPAYDLREK